VLWIFTASRSHKFISIGNIYAKSIYVQSCSVYNKLSKGGIYTERYKTANMPIAFLP